MRFTVIIPARYASTRLPGKPLLDIAGKPMIQHVYERAAASGAERVLVATDDSRIADCVKSFQGEYCLTRSDHPSGTDRLQEVATQLGLQDNDIVVNVQGDEPMLPEQLITQVAKTLADEPQADIATLAEPIDDVVQLQNSNNVKVVLDHQNFALYFSRAPIPWDRRSSSQSLPLSAAPLRHIGIYAYRVSFLNHFVACLPSPLEQIESLEQLRALHYGKRIKVAIALGTLPGGVDTREDLIEIRKLFEQNQP